MPLTATIQNGGFEVALTFSGTDLVGGSLIDGVYTLNVNNGLIRDALNRVVTGGSQTLNFHRLFGDADGTTIVNNADSFALRSTYLKNAGDPGFNRAFDFNGNGQIRNDDNFQFKNRYLVDYNY